VPTLKPTVYMRALPVSGPVHVLQKACRWPAYGTDSTDSTGARLVGTGDDIASGPRIGGSAEQRRRLFSVARERLPRTETTQRDRVNRSRRSALVQPTGNPQVRVHVAFTGLIRLRRVSRN
jgi:hypothetical protein